MSFRDRLKEARKKSGLNQDELAEMLGIAKTTISGYETGRREPEIAVLSKIMDVLKVDANYLYQDEIDFLKNQNSLIPGEYESIKKYRFLDEHGKQLVDFVLSAEYERCESIAPPKHTYSYMRRIAAAGTGFLIDDIPIETIEAPEMSGANFIIGVNGDSMEPTFFDGDLVYVQRTNTISIGEIGIFIYCGECYIKELGENGLISHNKNYKEISGNKEIRCIGRVLGKVEGI